ncbi:hypothetical protein [Nocardia callitridis]|uniref:Uncharacterized protein n=1 Tax=Nocardia callitridis TaxID=648753 RepID=A0ABP9JUP1_9NOCA
MFLSESDREDSDTALIAELITTIDNRLNRAEAAGCQLLLPRADIYARVLFALLDSAFNRIGVNPPSLLNSTLLDPTNDPLTLAGEVTELDHFIDATIRAHTTPAD